MKKKEKKIQIRIFPGREDDVIDYLSSYNKNEIHSVIIAAVRMKMTGEGYFQSRITANAPMSNTADSNVVTNKGKGVFDLKAMEIFSSIED
ncbi:Uncharacterized protein dnl_09120 [Desulfonema limicola]|uniref:Uncharacterized protein n=1 Tax=Desulfonema limicola TaxID=45656 RepID=A0A975B4L8_9BACT|nr:hypothetical protein [Desulfonema limicola]QTA78682.1 Uncharacterized protein dnl_09120 [Desulfonema limicola]